MHLQDVSPLQRDNILDIYSNSSGKILAIEEVKPDQNSSKSTYRLVNLNQNITEDIFQPPTTKSKFIIGAPGETIVTNVEPNESVPESYKMSVPLPAIIYLDKSNILVQKTVSKCNIE